MSEHEPVTRDPRLTELVGRLTRRGPDGWRPDGWGFSQTLTAAVLHLGRPTPGSPLVRLGVTPTGHDSPLAVAYSTDHPGLELLLARCERQRGRTRRAAARLLTGVLDELDRTDGP